MTVIAVHGGCGNPSGGTIRGEDDYHRGLSEAVLRTKVLRAEEAIAMASREAERKAARVPRPTGDR